MVNQLHSKLRHGNARQRSWVAYELGNTNDPEVVPYLIWAYNDTDETVRRTARDGLVANKSKEAQDFLGLTGLQEDLVVLSLRDSWPPTIREVRQLLNEIRSSGDGEAEHQQASDLISETAEGYFQKGRTLLFQVSPHERSQEQAREIYVKSATNLIRSINESASTFPDAYGTISFVLFSLGDMKRAKKYSEIALSQDSHNYEGGLTKFLLASKATKHYEQQKSYSGSGTVDLRFFLVDLLLQAGLARGKKSKLSRLKSELSRLASESAVEFSQSLANDADENVANWVWMAGALLMVGQALNEHKITNSDPCNAVLNVPWDEVYQGRYSEEIRNLRARARDNTLSPYGTRSVGPIRQRHGHAYNLGRRIHGLLNRSSR